jgi:hypothetical protein
MTAARRPAFLTIRRVFFTAALAPMPFGPAVQPLIGSAPFVTVARAQASDEENAFNKASTDPTISNLRDYLRRFPFGAHRNAIRALMNKRQEEIAWQTARQKGTRAALTVYLDLYPSGAHAADAKTMISSLAQGGGDLVDYPGTVLNGTISDKLNTDLEACKNKCKSASLCAGYDFSGTDKSCRLYSSVISARVDPDFSAGTRDRLSGYAPPPIAATQQQLSAPDILQGQQAGGEAAAEPNFGDQQAAAAPQQPPAPPPPSFNRFINRDMAGNAVQTLTIDNLDGCESVCASTNYCAAYTYNRWAHLCFLKSSTGELKVNARVTTGVRTSYGVPPTSSSSLHFEYFNGKGFFSTPARQNFAASRDGCANACWNWDACIAFSFHRTEDRCDMYDQTDQYYTQRGVLSGAKRQD